MSIAADTDELETAIIKDTAPAGGTSTNGMDADRDRVIEGYELFPEAVNDNDVASDAEAYIGVDPDVNDGERKDLGGKFFAQAHLRVSATNGHSVLIDAEHPVEGGLSWDWNEDAVLTLDVEETTGGNNVRWVMIVYYREV